MEKDARCSPVDSLKTWATTSGSVKTIVLEVTLSFATRPFEQFYWFSLCTAPSKRPKVLPPKINFLISFYADQRVTYIVLIQRSGLIHSLFGSFFYFNYSHTIANISPK